MSITLAGKKVVIIGGSSGLGFGVAKAALEDRAADVIIASSSKPKVDGAVERLRAIVKEKGLEGVVSGAVVDATKSEDIKTFFAGVGEIDHLVWTSGEGIGAVRTPFKDVDLERPDRADMFNLKFWGTAACAQAAKFRNGFAASFTLTTGTSMFKPSPNWSLLAGGLGAVDALGRGLAVDLAPVRVNVLCPGFVTTELWDVSGFSKEAQEARVNALSEKLLVKHVADAEEVAEAYLFLMKCNYITGQTIQVDGGATLI